MRFFLSMLLLSSLISPGMAIAQQMLLLTGKISSSEKQVVTAPRSSRWNVQIQWMEEEGKVVEKGDLVAVFDGSLIQSQLEANLEKLETEQLELTQKTMTLDQDFIDAFGELNVAKMRVEKARIEASVPDSQVSQFDKGKYVLELQRALLEQVKAEEKLNLAKQALRTGVEKQKIEIQRIEQEIAFQRKQLKTMSIKAEFNGPVTYAMHPWNGEKMASGTNVQAAWNILDVQATDNFQIESWVHEIDVDKVRDQQQVTLTLDAYPGKTFSGELWSISTQTEKQSQWSDSVYYPVIYQFNKTPGVVLLPGMSVRVAVPQNGVEQPQ